MARARDDLAGMASSLGTARREFKNAMFMLNMVALASTLALAMLFSSVLMVSLSILLSHYPRLFEKKPPAVEPKVEQPTAPHHHEPVHRAESQQAAFRKWQPGQSRLANDENRERRL
jgi:hypothetical protein